MADQIWHKWNEDKPQSRIAEDPLYWWGPPLSHTNCIRRRTGHSSDTPYHRSNLTDCRIRFVLPPHRSSEKMSNEGTPEKLQYRSKPCWQSFRWRPWYRSEWGSPSDRGRPRTSNIAPPPEALPFRLESCALYHRSCWVKLDMTSRNKPTVIDMWLVFDTNLAILVCVALPMLFVGFGVNCGHDFGTSAHFGVQCQKTLKVSKPLFGTLFVLCNHRLLLCRQHLWSKTWSDVPMDNSSAPKLNSVHLLSNDFDSNNQYFAIEWVRPSKRWPLSRESR